MNKQKQAFTLVELIVVITILAILGTIAFISLQGYSKSARDSVRTSDISKIKTSLELFQLNAGKYPEVSDVQEIIYSGAIAWTQGTFGETTFTSVDKLDKIPKDPLIDRKYTYSTTNTKQEYQIAGLMEGDELGLLNSKVNAVTKTATLKISGNYNGKLLKVRTGSIDYVLAIPSIITSEGFDVKDIADNDRFAYNGYKNLPVSYSGTSYEVFGDGLINLVDSSNLVLFEGQIGDLSKSEETAKRKLFLEKMQGAYTGTLIAGIGEIAEILNTTGDTAIEVLSSTLVSNDLGGTIISGSSNSIIDENEEENDAFLYASCKAILESEPSSENGEYSIDPENNGIGFNVYCDMTNYGGGWALVAYHADNVTPQISAGTITPSGNYGVLNDVNWQSLRDSMTIGMMLIDENSNVTTISNAKLNSASCHIINNKSSLTDGVAIMHHENSGCDLVGLDYSGIELNINSITGANVFAHSSSSLQFDVWEYPEWYSQNYQNELYYYIK